MSRDPVRRSVLVYFEDGPLEGRIDQMDEQIVVNGAKVPYIPPPEQVAPDESLVVWRSANYEFEERVQTITPYHRKRYVVASCRQRWAIPFSVEDTLQQFIRHTPLEVEQPKGSRDFESWWAMRMIECGRAKNNWLAQMWESELKAYGCSSAA